MVSASERMVMKCPKCNSHDVDPATVGLPGAMQCLDCGYLFPDIMGLVSWPFPDSLRPKKLNDQLPQRYNPANDDPSPL